VRQPRAIGTAAEALKQVKTEFWRTDVAILRKGMMW
jgi:hypothetical protein